MTDRDLLFFLPGGGVGEEEMPLIRALVEADNRFRMVSFPGWRRYVSREFSAEGVLADIVALIDAKVSKDRIWLAGLSLGAHFGYAAAVRLQQKGRDIAGFCAIDGLMNGYPVRQAFQLLRERQFRHLWELSRAKARHSVIRLRGHRHSGSQHTQLSSLVLWLAAARTWTLSLDIDPIPLMAANALVRTRPGAADDEVWKRRCPGLRIFTVPGTHQTMFDPNNVTAFRQAFTAAMQSWP